MYRVALESILGFKQRGDMLFIEPCIPASWKEFTIEYRVGASTYEITIENPDGLERGGVDLTVDGNAVDEAIHLVDDGKRHRATASLRSSSSPVRASRSEPDYSGTVDDLAVRVETRSVARTIPGFLGAVPVDDAIEVCAYR